jgi:5'-nucleotidase
MEGAARFVPSIALSQVYRNEINWHNTRIFAPKVIAKLVIKLVGLKI